MVADLLRELTQACLAASAAVLLVLAVRAGLRRLGGADIAYSSWALVPLAMLAVWLPAPTAGRGATFGRTLDAMPRDLPAAADPGPWLLGTWLVGTLLTAALFAVRQWRFQATLRVLPGHEHPSGAIAGPAVIGLLRPRIVLPERFHAHWSPAEQALVLEHERLHVQRGDLLAQAVATGLRCLFWFNPLLPWAERRFRHDQELACDAQLLRRHPHSRRSYGNAMLKTHLADAGLPLGCHWQPGHSLKERILMLKQPQPGTFRRRTTAFAITALLAGATALAWAAQPAVAAAPAPATTAPDTTPATAPTDAKPLQAATDADVLTPPKYPAAAVAEGIGGQVVLDILVGVDGRPRDVRVFSSRPEGLFDQAAIDAARQWQFNAGRNGATGEKVEGWVRVPVRFAPDGEPGT